MRKCQNKKVGVMSFLVRYDEFLKTGWDEMEGGDAYDCLVLEAELTWVEVTSERSLKILGG